MIIEVLEKEIKGILIGKNFMLFQFILSAFMLAFEEFEDMIPLNLLLLSLCLLSDALSHACPP